MAKTRKKVTPPTPPVDPPVLPMPTDAERATAAAQAAEALRRAQELEGTNPAYLSGVSLTPGGAAPDPQTINAAIAKALGAEVPPTRGPGYRFPQTGPEGETGYGYAKPIEEPKVRSYYFDQPEVTAEDMAALLRKRIDRISGQPSGPEFMPAEVGGMPSVVDGLPFGYDLGGPGGESLLDFKAPPPMPFDASGFPSVRLADEPQMNLGLPPDKKLPLGLNPNDIDYVDAGGSSPLPGDAARQKAAADAAAASQKAQGAAGDSKVEPDTAPPGPATPGKSYAPSAILKRMGVAMRPGKVLKDYAWPVAREVGATAILGTGAVLAPSAIARLARGYGPAAAKWVKESWMQPGEEQPAQAAPQPAADPSYIPPPQQEGQGGPRPQYLENLRRSRYQIGDPNSSDIIRTLTQSRGMA
jgi:hypothetical protein